MGTPLWLPPPPPPHPAAADDDDDDDDDADKLPAASTSSRPLFSPTRGAS
jgi:hypothetical protein